MASLPDLLAGGSRLYRSLLALPVTTSQTLYAPVDGIVDLTGVGGGGAGASYLNGYIATGGGAGGFCRRIAKVKKGDAIVITIGAGGTVSLNNANGSSGGATSIVIASQAVNMTANGGAGGVYSNYTGAAIGGGEGGTASGGQINATGGRGGSLLGTSGFYPTGGNYATGGGGVNALGLVNPYGVASATTAGGDIVISSAASSGYGSTGGGGANSPGAPLNQANLTTGSNGGNGVNWMGTNYPPDAFANWGVDLSGGGSIGVNGSGGTSSTTGGAGGGGGGVTANGGTSTLVAGGGGIFAGGGAVGGNFSSANQATGGSGGYGGGGGGAAIATPPGYARGGAGGSGYAFIRFFADLTP